MPSAHSLTRRLDTVRQDAGYALRACVGHRSGASSWSRRSHGVGVATAVFTIADVMLLRPLPYEGAERLVVPYQTVMVRSRASQDTVPWSFGQIALASLLLVVAALMTQSLRRLLGADLGFRGDGVLALGVASMDTSAASRVRRQELMARLEHTPGIGCAEAVWSKSGDRSPDRARRACPAPHGGRGCRP